MDNCGKLELIHATKAPTSGRGDRGLPWFQRVTGNKGSIPEREPEKRLPHPWKAAGAQITQSRHGEERLEGKSGASSRGNSSSNSLNFELVRSVRLTALYCPGGFFLLVNRRALHWDVFINQERRLGDRKRSDTKNKVNPALCEPEISDEQPWRKAVEFPNPVVHFDYQAPYRYMRIKPTEKILDTPLVLWAQPFGEYRCTDDRLKTVIDAVSFLEPQASSPEVVFQTDSGFYLLKFEAKRDVKRLLKARVALNLRNHRAVFFYECLTVPTTKSIIISDSVQHKHLRTIRTKVEAPVSDILERELKLQPAFQNFVPKITNDAMIAGTYKELTRFVLNLDFAEGLEDEKTQEATADAMWAWDSRWAQPWNNALVLSIDQHTAFKFRLQPLCAYCHSDGHWKHECRWKKVYQALRDWTDKVPDEDEEA
ncbi:hypothetical protein C8R48DRAFT_766368 [Suillus tomentosus]|nr:hypothetical protein C8R48DRAFT_766368 [Suillus tomentosus]